jgi:hypothetical protein
VPRGGRGRNELAILAQHAGRLADAAKRGPHDVLDRRALQLPGCFHVPPDVADDVACGQQHIAAECRHDRPHVMPALLDGRGRVGVVDDEAQVILDDPQRLADPVEIHIQNAQDFGFHERASRRARPLTPPP